MEKLQLIPFLMIATAGDNKLMDTDSKPLAIITLT